MKLSLKAHEFIKPQGPLLVAILDGIGIGRADAFDAVHLANTPTLDKLFAKSDRFCELLAHGKAVGLPSDKDMGNSEVGHNALGCGRVVTQGAGLVDNALKSGELFESRGYREVREAFTKGGTLHFIGLLSDGGVHSRFDQLQKLVEESARLGAQKIRVHVLTDGRDVPDNTALSFVERLEKVLAGTGVDAKIASGGGRMTVTMDRYEADWNIVERGWNAHVHGEGRTFESAGEAIKTFRDEDPELTDQTYPPFVIADERGPVGKILDGDAVLCFNFRGDRAIEISRAFSEDDFDAFDRRGRPRVVYAGMMEYDGDLHIPPRSLVDPPAITDTAGEILVHNRVRTFACSETQKFGHVTYFWNGNRTGTFDDAYERYVEIESDRIAFNKRPEMKALEICKASSAALRSGDYDLVRINLANGDMVGHTGDLAATIKGVECVDAELKKLLHVVDEMNGRFMVTADHGNADDMAMRNKAGDALRNPQGKIIARTSHTLASVGCAIGGAGLANNVVLRELEGAGLANTTATHLELLGFKAPLDYEPSLLAQKR